jgi:transcriptional regulator with XRE-family HTH domain
MPDGLFYRQLGRNLRVARGVAGKTQVAIAEHLDITFQQVQKYETGTNRIPVDRLVSLADFLDLPLSQFIAPSKNDSDFQSLAAQFSAREFHELMEVWGTIKDRPTRAALLSIAKRVADLK